MNIYTIFDKKAQTYSDTLFTAVNDSTAVRIMSMTVENDRMMFTHASDFDLYKIGTYEEKSGKVESSNEFVINLQSVKDEQIKRERAYNEEN